jgi:flavin reductase (DIM6/NTAB) family NADH-FMN oxidoreductase RutF
MKSIGPKTVLYPTPVMVVGSYDKDKKPNAMTAAWGGICCSIPPSISVSLRKATYTYGNIMESRGFTINIPGEKWLKKADYFGLVSGKTEDKFKATGLTPVQADFVNAPYIKEFPLVIECALSESIEVGLHTLFIGEIKDVKVDEAACGEDGQPDIEKIMPVIFVPERRTYYGLGKFLGKAFSIGKGG